MIKRVGVLALFLVGSLAVLQPQVAQAHDRDDYRHYDRHEDRRDWGRDRRDYQRRQNWREERREDWRDRERWERRDFRGGYGYRPYYENRYQDPYCPRY